jgi:hypothetical protein
MEIRNKFNIGEEVYLITDRDNELWLIVSIIIDKQGLMYGVRSNGKNLTLYDFEISTDKQY